MMGRDTAVTSTSIDHRFFFSLFEVFFLDLYIYIYILRKINFELVQFSIDLVVTLFFFYFFVSELL